MWRHAQGILFAYVMYYVTQSAFYEHTAVTVDVLEWAKVITMCPSSRKYLGKTDVTSRALCSMLRILGTLQQTFLNKKALINGDTWTYRLYSHNVDFRNICTIQMPADSHPNLY